MHERDRGRGGPLPAAVLALTCAAAPFHPGALLAVGAVALLLGLRQAPAKAQALTAGAGLAAGCALAGATGTQSFLVIVYGAAGALAAVLFWALGRHLDERERYRETGWRLAWALDDRRRAVDAEARASERARIAAEMHDSLGHDMALIAVRASALEAQASTPSAGAPQRAELTELRTAAAEATERLHEIVALLGAERPDPSAAPPGETVAALIARAEAAGMAVRPALDPSWSGTADPRRVPAHRAVHRTVEESLTNAAKHAPGTPVAISVREQGGTVRVLVRTPLPAPDAHPPEDGAAPSGGRGLRALSERVRLLGGTVDWGPQGGDFRLEAAIPVDGAPSTGVGGDTDTGAGTGTGTGGADAAGPGVLDEGLDPDHHRWSAAQRRRRSLRALVLAPLAVLAGTGVLMAAAFVFTNVASVLPADRFAGIHPRQSRAEAQELLPLVQMPDAPVADEPTRDCRYYEASVSFFERVDVFQVCFTGDSVARTATVPAESG